MGLLLTRALTESRGMNDMKMSHGLKLENGRLEIILPIISGINEVVLKESPTDKGVLMVPKENRRSTGGKEDGASGNNVISCKVSFKQGN